VRGKLSSAINMYNRNLQNEYVSSTQPHLVMSVSNVVISIVLSLFLMVTHQIGLHCGGLLGGLFGRGGRFESLKSGASSLVTVGLLNTLRSLLIATLLVCPGWAP
jgi:hypothetical protein